MTADLRLEEITADSVREVLAPSVAFEQRDFVAPNATSIAEASFNTGAWCLALVAQGRPVGFASFFDPSLPGALPRPGIEPGDVLLWRFMIDRRYQGCGYGRLALDLIRAEVRRPGVQRLIASYVPAPAGPEAFYLGYGFAKTGRLRALGTEIEVAIVP